jgi:hypothetical protein
MPSKGVFRSTPSPLRPYEATEHVDQRRLAGAVRADEPTDRPIKRIESIDGNDGAEGDGELVDLITCVCVHRPCGPRHRSTPSNAARRSDQRMQQAA